MTTISYRSDWSDSGRLVRLLDRLNAGTSPNNDGSITFTDDDFQQYFDLLGGAFRACAELTSDEVRRHSYRSFIKLRKSGPVQTKALLVELNKQLATLLSGENRRFTMWTSIRLVTFGGERNVKFQYDGVQLEIRSCLPKWLHLDDYFISGVGDVMPNELSRYAYLICRVDARNEDAAMDLIYRGIDALLSVSNVLWRSIPMWTQRHSQAHLWIGRLQFIFERRKFLCKEKIWYDPQFSRSEWDRFPKRRAEFDKYVDAVRAGLAQLQTHNLRDLITRSSKLVVEGMVSPHLSYRLLRYWGALETLYSDGKSRPTAYDRLIRRAAFGDYDRELTVMKLEHLRDLRNDYVHAGDTDRELNDLINYLGDLLCRRIGYLLRIGNDFKDHAEFIEMSDLPHEEAKMERLRIAIQRRDKVIATGRHR